MLGALEILGKEASCLGVCVGGSGAPLCAQHGVSYCFAPNSTEVLARYLCSRSVAGAELATWGRLQAQPRTPALTFPGELGAPAWLLLLQAS